MHLLTGRAQSTLINQIHHVDLFTLCDWLWEAGIKVDMIAMDLPYGITAIKEWDSVIAFEPMWKRLKRVIKPRGAIVLTASQPFTSALVMSNVGMYRHNWVWHKDNSAGFATVNMRPFAVTEDVLVFGIQGVNYYPIMEVRGNPRKKGGYGNSAVYGIKPTISISNVYYPKNVLHFGNADQTNKVHPTQKPVALFEYLIRTYTRPGELVLDATCGSGTTGLAARNCGRQFVCGDTSLKYVEIARRRLAEPYTMPTDKRLSNGEVQKALFVEMV
jgi:site-specific DNA-methyltransferase (adenine-specific)